MLEEIYYFIVDELFIWIHLVHTKSFYIFRFWNLFILLILFQMGSIGEMTWTKLIELYEM
jgi:hypothetical protein